MTKINQLLKDRRQWLILSNHFNSVKDTKMPFYRLSIIALMLSLAVLCSAQFAGGSGTVNDPWQIAIPEHLNSVRLYLGEEHADKYFIQTADINLNTPPWNEGEGWSPIGNSQTNAFQGNYNGDNYAIEGLYIFIANYNMTRTGLFGFTSGATISNLALTDLNINTNYDVGGLIGRSYNSSIINCYTTGSIIGNYAVGGLICIASSSLITDSYSSAYVSGELAGGLIGQNNDTSVSNCYSDGEVVGIYVGGGLIGANSNSLVNNSFSQSSVSSGSYWGYHLGAFIGRDTNSTITNCYSTGNVSGDGTYSGGFIGLTSGSVISSSYSSGSVNGLYIIGGFTGQSISSIIFNCYSKGIVEGYYFAGGFAGSINESILAYNMSTGVVMGSGGNIGGLIGQRQSSTVNACYWNIETSGQTNSAGGDGRTTAEMTSPYAANTYINWDFIDIWGEDYDYSINNGYPYLYQVEMNPMPAVVISPADGELEVIVHELQLKWQVGAGAYPPSGYRVYFGTDNPPGNIENGTDLGNVTLYEHDQILLHGTEYYWQIIPYNNTGDAQNCPVWSFTTAEADFAGGFGTAEDPWQITTAAHLNNIRYYLGVENNDKFFIQTTDINLGIAPWNLANGWEPIGNSSGNSFSGTYDGNNYSVDGLYINRNDFLDSFQGLFGYATGALIKNIALTNVNVICGGERTGTLLGQSWNSTIINCSSTGTKQGRMWTGGLVGRIADNSLVDNCFSRVNISGSSNVGGLVGICEDSTISNSYSMGNVSGNSYVGGLVGRSFFANILNTYSTGYVTGTEYVGGLNGVSTNTTIINSYWNIETSGQSTSSGAAEGRSTTEMTYPYAPNTYVDWDFTDIWIADQYYMANEGYPYLRSQISQYPDIAINPIPPTGSENVSVHLEQVAWSYAINPFFITPAGFRVYLNTTDVFEDDDFIWIPYYENQIEYSCSEIITELAYSTTYYWQVIPSTIDPTEQRGKVRSTRDFYKASSDHDKIPRNDAQNCPVWNFTTEQDSSLDDTEIHLSTELTGNFPNPFNPETTIKFTLSQQGEVKLTIYNIKGQLVRTLLDEYRELGEHWIIWNGQDERGRVVPSGVYLYQLLTERETITNRMIMLK